MKLFWLSVLSLSVFLANAQGNNDLFKQYKFNLLNEGNGLTNNVVNDILQDTLGQIWVATEEGLFRYQGFEFQKFVKDRKNPELIHNNFIDQLYLDKKNNIWLMTDDGVATYSYQSDIIQRFLPSSIKGRISSMIMDRKDDLYFGRYEGGILHVKNEIVEILNLYDQNTGIDFSDFSILELDIVGDDIWANVSDIGVIQYNITDKKITFFSAKEIANKDKVTLIDLYIDNKQNVWIGTDKSVYTLAIKNNGDKSVNNALEVILPQDDYLTIFRDEKGKLWIGSRQNGLFTVTKTSNGEFELGSHFKPGFDPYSISHRTVSKIFQENNGFIWLGTHNGGINVFQPDGEVVRTVTRRLEKSDVSISYQNVWGMSESSDGSIWVGTDGKGLSKLNPSTGKVQNDIIPTLKNKAILCAKEDIHGRLWLGTYAHGIYVFDPTDSSLAQYSTDSPKSELRVNDIRCFYEDYGGKMYIGTNQGGLYYHDSKSNKIVLVQNLPYLDIRAIVANNAEFLWLGTYGDGVKKIDIRKEEVVSTIWETDTLHSNEIVFDIYNDSTVLWVATRHNGTVAYHMDKNIFVPIEQLEPLRGISISAIRQDRKNNLWITSSTGVSSFNRKSKNLVQFGAEHGFQSGHFNYGSIFLSKHGYVATGGIHGMNLFYPDELIAASSQSDIVFNQFKIFDQVVNPSNSSAFGDGKSIFLTEEIQLDYQDNIFSIQFSHPGFTTYSKNDFIYMLEGYEDQWQYGAESNIATYRNVPPGNYQFKIKNHVNGEAKSLAIVIAPPIWRTWQAYTIAFIVCAYLLFRIAKFNSSRIALKEKLKFEKDLREREQLVMKEKLHFYTNFSHELKTPLTLIQGPVSDLISKEQNAESLLLLQMIRKNTDILLKFIGRMLEFRKIELNKSLLNVGYHDLYILAQEEAESFTHLAKEKKIIFGFYCEQDLHAWVDLEKIQIVISNLLSNAFKFSPEGKTIKFGMFHDRDDVIIEVKDEGKGIAEAEQKSIFSPFFQASNSLGTGGTGIGLALCKNFVGLHKGQITLESKLGLGTIFTVRLSKKKSDLEKLDYVRFLESSEVASLEGGDHHETLPIVESLESTINDSEKVILVVDDNKDIAAYIKSIFIEDYKIVTQSNGKDGLESAISLVPDLILSDIMMPDIDGIEFCEKIKNHFATSHIPIILLTAKNSDASKIKGFNVGADDYITKPFSSEVLKVRVHNLLTNRHSLELKYSSQDLLDPETAHQSKEAEFILELEETIVNLLETSDFGVPELCAAVGMSQTSLYRKVKSTTGDSILSLIRKIRIKRAAHLLLIGDMTVSEVCYAVYFSDPKYFRKCFKEQYDMSPTEYKHQFSTNGISNRNSA